MNKIQCENTDGKQSELNNEREVDTADAPALNITTHYTYNSIPSEAQAKTIQKVCSICSKRVLQTVVVQYDECRCIRRMCRDCDAELEKSGTDSCEIHSLSRRDTRRRRKKTRTT